MTRARIAVIVNPASGGPSARRVARRIQPLFAAAGIVADEIVTTSPGGAREYARLLPADEYSTVCAVGGDGTVHAIVNGLMQRDDPRAIALAIVPAGSGNALMRQFSLDPLDAARRIVAGEARDLDVMQVRIGDTTKYSFNVIGWAMAGDGAATAESLRFIGPSRYHVAALLELARHRTHRARLTIGDETIEREFAFLMACNSRYTGAGMLIAPRAELDDGLIDLVFIPPRPRARLLKMFRCLKDGTHLQFDEVVYRQVERFSLVPETSAHLMIDGEITRAAAMEVRALPASLRLITDSSAMC